MTPADERLDALAKAAPKGPWCRLLGSALVVRDDRGREEQVAECEPMGGSSVQAMPRRKATADYIAAASPDVVRGLLARLAARTHPRVSV